MQFNVRKNVGALQASIVAVLLVGKTTVQERSRPSVIILAEIGLRSRPLPGTCGLSGELPQTHGLNRYLAFAKDRPFLDSKVVAQRISVQAVASALRNALPRMVLVQNYQGNETVRWTPYAVFHPAANKHQRYG